MISYRRMTAGALLFSQVVLVILYAVLTEYGDGPSATTTKNNGEHSSVYPYYQDVHVMIFIGFGFLHSVGAQDFCFTGLMLLDSIH